MRFDLRENELVLDKSLFYPHNGTDSKAQHPGQRMPVNAGSCHQFDTFIVPAPHL